MTDKEQDTYPRITDPVLKLVLDIGQQFRWRTSVETTWLSTTRQKFGHRTLKLIIDGFFFMVDIISKDDAHVYSYYYLNQDVFITVFLYCISSFKCNLSGAVLYCHNVFFLSFYFGWNICEILPLWEIVRKDLYVVICFGRYFWAIRKITNWPPFDRLWEIKHHTYWIFLSCQWCSSCRRG